jgi:ABC-type Fe3+-siderophore transport system permease subunit
MSARRVIIHRGLCGVSLRTQCLGIAGTYTFISSIGVFLASLMLHSPASYVRLEEAITKEHHDTSAILVNNVTDISTNSTMEEQETATDELEAITNHLIKQVGQNAIEMLIGGLATFFCSILLIQGIRKNKTTWMFPWIVESSISTFASFILFLVQVASPTSLSVFKAFLVVLFFALSVYFILSVYSLYMILKIQKKSVTTFLDHEFQQGSSFYHTLEDEEPHMPPYREKTVPMTESEDKGREHVLYAKM